MQRAPGAMPSPRFGPRQQVSVVVLAGMLALGGCAAPAAAPAGGTTPSGAAPAGVAAAPAPGASAPAAPVSAPAAAPEVVKFATSPAVSTAGVFIGMERGYFRDVGLEIEIVQF